MPNQRYSHYTNPMLHQPGPPVSQIMSPDGVQFHQPVQTQGQYVQTEVQPDNKGWSILRNAFSIFFLDSEAEKRSWSDWIFNVSKSMTSTVGNMTYTVVSYVDPREYFKPKKPVLPV